MIVLNSTMVNCCAAILSAMPFDMGVGGISIRSIGTLVGSRLMPILSMVPQFAVAVGNATSSWLYNVPDAKLFGFCRIIVVATLA